MKTLKIFITTIFVVFMIACTHQNTTKNQLNDSLNIKLDTLIVHNIDLNHKEGDTVDFEVLLSESESLFTNKKTKKIIIYAPDATIDNDTNSENILSIDTMCWQDAATRIWHRKIRKNKNK